MRETHETDVMTWFFSCHGFDAVIRAQHVAADDLELLAELVLQFALPLEGEVGRRDDQGALDQAANLQFLDQQAGHDGLAGAGIVGQQEADARQLHEVVVNGFELVRQRIDAGDREREVRIVLVGQTETQCLDAQAKPFRIAVERLFSGETSSCASCSALRTGSWTCPVVRPLAMTLTDAPSARRR